MSGGHLAVHIATDLVIFITGHGDIPMSVKDMKASAVDFLPKPFEGQQLLGRVDH